MGHGSAGYGAGNFIYCYGCGMPELMMYAKNCTTGERPALMFGFRHKASVVLFLLALITSFFPSQVIANDDPKWLTQPVLMSLRILNQYIGAASACGNQELLEDAVTIHVSLEAAAIEKYIFSSSELGELEPFWNKMRSETRIGFIRNPSMPCTKVEEKFYSYKKRLGLPVDLIKQGAYEFPSLSVLGWANLNDHLEHTTENQKNTKPQNISNTVEQPSQRGNWSTTVDDYKIEGLPAFAGGTDPIGGTDEGTVHDLGWAAGTPPSGDTYRIEGLSPLSGGTTPVYTNSGYAPSKPHTQETNVALDWSIGITGLIGAYVLWRILCCLFPKFPQALVWLIYDNKQTSAKTATLPQLPAFSKPLAACLFFLFLRGLVDMYLGLSGDNALNFVMGIISLSIVLLLCAQTKHLMGLLLGAGWLLVRGILNITLFINMTPNGRMGEFLATMPLSTLPNLIISFVLPFVVCAVFIHTYKQKSAPSGTPKLP